MSPIDTKRSFISINIAILTISDSRTLQNDSSGKLLEERITSFGHKILDRQIIADDVSLIKKIPTTIGTAVRAVPSLISQQEERD